jgi:glycine/D-amino acid oxidase-like deaminating enzyme
MKKIAILGAGLCGLAAAWMLKSRIQDNCEITLFDPLPVGKGTSGIAAGLLHPFVGLNAKLNPEGFEGFAATKELLAVSAKCLGKPVAECSGFLRIACDPEQQLNFRKTAEKYPEHVDWVEDQPGIFIRSALTVYMADYLMGLWMACEKQGTKLIQQKVTSLAELDSFDQIVVTMGADSTTLPELSEVPIRRTKGQLFEISKKVELSCPLNHQLYYLMSKDRNNIIVGSTYEKQFVDGAPDIEVAKELLLPKFLPAFKDSEIIACRAGVRGSTPNRLPLIKQINQKCWLLAGMGSRGLLYHALYAKKLEVRIFQAFFTTEITEEHREG